MTTKNTMNYTTTVEDKEEFDARMIKDINDYQPYQTKSYMTNELDDSGVDNGKHNEMNNRINDNSYVENDDNYIEYETEDYEEQYAIENDKEEQKQEMDGTTQEAYDIFAEDLEPKQYSSQEFDKLSCNKLVDLEDIYQEDNNEENEITNKIIELSEEDGLPTNQEEMTLENIKQSRINWFTSSGRPICTPQSYLNWAVPLKSESKREEYGVETSSIIGKICAICNINSKTNLIFHTNTTT